MALDDLSPLTSLPYREAHIATILIIASFLLFLNLSRGILSRLVSAGLLGPLLIGAAYSASLSSILPSHVQYSVQAFGYLGLMLLIVEGGMDTRLDILSNRRTLVLALLVGTTGIVVPIALSLALLPFAYGYGYIESFALGASLSSTSLGTIFSVISNLSEDSGPPAGKLPSNQPIQEGAVASMEVDTNGHDGDRGEETIIGTSIGTILVAAALLDDIVGLVISSIISNLPSTSSGSQSIAPWSAARPLVASVSLLVFTAIISRYVLSPLNNRGSCQAPGWIFTCLTATKLVHNLDALAVVAFIAVVATFATIASYIGSSILIGCFCAGATMKHLYDGLVAANAGVDRDSPLLKLLRDGSPEAAFSRVKPIQELVLGPFFFASIGSAIPVKEMFRGQTVWRASRIGIIYAGLMGVGKLCAGSWIILADTLLQKKACIWRNRSCRWSRLGRRPTINHCGRHDSRPVELGNPLPAPMLPTPGETQLREQVLPRLIPSWPSAMFLGLSLVARGEIGFLIINIASQQSLVSSEAFNVAVWAITLNTIVGPATVGILLRSVPARNAILGGRWGTVERRA
ncbi:hypothetical protein PUNSTDRAFT_60904 [Punctularia strigosozonata HHB-11173 SS5]|uniref:uncharacterized protein n=1 Tax=Punctularia strigosozonata (strain HHB-11173) TaxID=741275 RepID=UPI00044170D7|nr:uncharacterized protein PUNSTDRAFT_60904 [Punctularia strigosozonata HHB-11173 SS5]EIN12653.1 hypothetical protein PUNSTDRAFT_60904 [Punctularia strigosozonata HHB-11173 SS5]